MPECLSRKKKDWMGEELAGGGGDHRLARAVQGPDEEGRLIPKQIQHKEGTIESQRGSKNP